MYIYFYIVKNTFVAFKYLLMSIDNLYQLQSAVFITVRESALLFGKLETFIIH